MPAARSIEIGARKFIAKRPFAAWNLFAMTTCAGFVGIGAMMLNLQTSSQRPPAEERPEHIARHAEAKRAAQEYNERMRKMVAETKNKSTGDKLRDASHAWGEFVRSQQDAGSSGGS